MIKKISALCLLATLFVFVGCTSVQTAQKLNDQKLTVGTEQSIGNINVTNWGLYLLWIPLITGDNENIGSVAWFKNTVTLEDVVGVATKKAKEMGATKAVDMTSMVTPGAFLFNIKQVQVSVNAVK